MNPESGEAMNPSTTHSADPAAPAHLNPGIDGNRNGNSLDSPSPRRVSFTVPGDPVGKADARRVTLNNGRRMGFVPKKTRNYMADVAAYASGAMDGAPFFEGPLRVRIRAFFAMPKSRHRKRSPRPAAPKTTKPDASNILKGVEDACTGVVWQDDNQVVDVRVEKWHAHQGEPGCLYVEIEEMAG